MTTKAQLTFDTKNNRYQCIGCWSIFHLQDPSQQISLSDLPTNKTVTISGEHLTQFDSAGALALTQCIAVLKKHHKTVDLIDFKPQHHDLLSMVTQHQQDLNYVPPEPISDSVLYQIGEETINKIDQVDGFVILLGDLTDKLFAAFARIRRFHYPSILANMAFAGINALPIIGLLQFLIGVVLAYQMGLQLETYGANYFISYLSGMAIFREFGPLIAAIIVAGRTSSAFTAQIGSMKINEEIDALYTMGLSPTELLIVPKVLGLLIIFPLLIFWSDFFGTLGAMIMSKYMLHIGHIDFLNRLRDSVGLKQMMLGLYKAPTFALIIALVGCFQGLRVHTSADSVGHQTTRSVVQALFLIIIADAAYSVIYNWMDL